MSAGRLSPSTNLLRNSRLFALPQALPQAFTNASSQQVGHSDTATTPYPTHAAIETSPDAYYRGEWGLKRALPLKSTTKTGTKYIRIKDGIDTREHITNFEPAADHVLTLRKFQSLNVPTLLPGRRGYQDVSPGGPSSTPFEEVHHRITKPNDKTVKRWRTAGPWIPGLSNLEYQDYLKKQVRPRKTEFRNFLKVVLQAEEEDRVFQAEKELRVTELSNLVSQAEEQLEEEEPKRMDREGWARGRMDYERSKNQIPKSLEETMEEDLLLARKGKLLKFVSLPLDAIVSHEASDSKSEPETATTPDAEAEPEPIPEKNLRTIIAEEDGEAPNFLEFLKILRGNPVKFTSLIQQFLDLPDTPHKGGKDNDDLKAWKLGPKELDQSTLATEAYREHGMPSTHPSAGLGYLRVSTFQTNDSLYGPQDQADPIPGRILIPGDMHMATKRDAKVGAAGFVAKITDTAYFGNADINDKVNRPLREFTPQPGGNKYPVRPSVVAISPDGRPVMGTSTPSQAKIVMAGLMPDMANEEYLERRRAHIQTSEQMPLLDGDYSGRSREDENAGALKNREALAKSRKALAGMLSARSADDEKEGKQLNDLLNQHNRL